MKSKKPSLYDAQEEQIQLQSASFVDFLTRKGVLEDHNIDNERVRKAKKDTAQRAYHNTEVLLSQYRLIIWVLEYFPFVTKAYDVMQVTAWAILILITIWQLFRAFGGPITEAENPWHLLVRSSVYGLLIGYAKPIFSLCLNIARAPYTTLMELSMTAEDFTFAGVEQTLTNGLLTIVSAATVVGLILILILEIALGWNYFKLLLETVERYIVVGVLCYTSPLAFSMGGSKTTSTVFKSWCRMVGSQLLLLVMNVWFLRGFASSMGQFIANGGALTTGKGSIFLWMFCALAYLKCAQRFDSYLASIGLNVAQTGSSMGMELMMAARVISGAGSSVRSAGSVFGRGGNAAATGTGAAANGFASGFAFLAFLFIPVYQANPLCRPFPRRTVSCTRESDSGRVQQHRPDRRRTGRLRFLPFPERHPLPGYSGHARRSEPWSASEPVSQQPLVRNHRQLRHPAYARLYG